MSNVWKQEQILLSKQILEAEIDNKISENKSEEMQLSIHILSGKNLPVSLNSKVHRQLKFSIENQIIKNNLCFDLNSDKVYSQPCSFL